LHIYSTFKIKINDDNFHVILIFTEHFRRIAAKSGAESVTNCPLRLRVGGYILVYARKEKNLGGGRKHLEKFA